MRNRSITLSDYELGWLVAILEGEGFFDYNGCSQKVEVCSTDEDVIKTCASIITKVIGVEATIFGRQVREGNKEQWEVRLTGERARTLMRLIVPYMHQRRRARIWQSLNKFKAPKLKFDIDQLMENIHARKSANLTGGRSQNSNRRNRNPDSDYGPEGDYAADIDDPDRTEAESSQ